MAKKNFYVVTIGRKPGIYTTWAECEKQVKGFSGASFKGFSLYDDAYAHLHGSTTKTPEVTNDLKSSNEKVLDVVPVSISTDAACSGNPGPLEYRAVWTDTGETIFQKSFPVGTANIGEFLALVGAIKHARTTRLNCPIYTDSITAISWVRKKNHRSTFDFSSHPELQQEIEEAVAYLQAHEMYDRVLKWHTSMQGEIKADYGRK